MLPVLSLFLLVYIFKSEIRYRIPFDVFVVPMALKALGRSSPRIRLNSEKKE